ncbi:MAG: hypothetical protein V1904_08905 [Bacteroidota bacterium]
MKTKKNKTCNIVFLLISISSFTLFSGCVHYYYAPNAHNVPMFQEKGEVRLAGVRSYGSYHEGTEFQGAFSITDKIGIIGNSYTAQGGDKEKNNYSEGSYYEAGCGYFKPVLEKFVFETYGGIGFGNVENRYKDYGYSNLDFYKYFLQPSFGFTTKFFDAVWSVRLCGLYYDRIDDHTIQDDKENTEYINNHKFSYLYEPAFTFRIGWKYLKIQIQYSISINSNYPEFPMDGANLNIGLYLSIANKYLKKNHKS